MLKVAIIIGSTRPGRKGVAVARWVYDIAARRGDASFEVVDIADFDLPLLDEPLPPIMNQYSKPHTRAWAAKIAAFDAFVLLHVHAPPAARGSRQRDARRPRRLGPGPSAHAGARHR